jgi:hypothetical protein
VDPSERSLPLLYPTTTARTFGDCELVETNVIKWIAPLIRVGKKW